MSHRALALVRNISAHFNSLDFGEFVLSNIRHPRLAELTDLFASEDVNINDWLLEKSYSVLPPGESPAGVGGIPEDIEDILFLLRLFKVGDIAFIRLVIIKPDNHSLVQPPYRMINNLNSYSTLSTHLGRYEADRWRGFADRLRASQSWRSEWLLVARRFFLYGGAKEFSPRWDEVDRIVDYATALEAVLVPEGEFSRSRSGNRAARLCSDTPSEQQTIANSVKRVYDIRSSIVHGSALSERERDWLRQNRDDVELRMRQVLIAALERIPADDPDRTEFLQSVFEVPDEKRGEFVLQKFREIQTQTVRKSTATEIVRLLT